MINKINKNTIPFNANKNNDRNTDKLLNNSTILISEIKENNEKSEAILKN